MIKKAALSLLLVIFSLQSAFAFLGTRPMGMGGAFTAVADDANAPYWNPAGLALNPEVAATGSLRLNNRNISVGDNVGNLKLSYETAMSPFEWIAGVGLASALALEGARYLSERGILKKGWGREGETTSREESMASQVRGTEEVVSLRRAAKKAVKEAAGGVLGGTRHYYMMPWHSPWYHPDFHRPRYWEPREETSATKAQFALGISWLNDYNASPSVDQNTNWYTITLASGFEQRVAIGANVNTYYLQKISTDVKGLGAGLDLGAIARPVDYISFGVVAKEILTTDVKWQTNDVTRYEMLVNAGVAVKPFYSLTLAADAHNLFRQNTTYHYGAEVVLLPGLLARAGLFDGNKTAGLSLAAGNLIVDYSILGGVFNRTQMFGLTWRF